MTGHQIDNFVGSLVEMAKAFEERPKLEQEITNLNNKISDISLDNSALRGSNDILRGHIETLTAKVAEVTKERDDAGFRCLEADDKAARILDLARTLASGLGQVIAEVEPPKPQEPVTDYVVPMHVTTQEPISVQEDPMPTVVTSTEDLSGSVHGSATLTENANTGTTMTNAGQSEPNPTTQSGEAFTTHYDHGQPASGFDTASQSSTTNVSESGETAEANSSNAKPYAGKRYTELSAWDRPNNFTTWEAGGGDWNGWVS